MKRFLQSLVILSVSVLINTSQLQAQEKTGLSLDGIDDYVNFSSTLANSINQTIEFWLKLDVVPTTGTKILVYNGNTSLNGYGLTLTNNKIYMLFGGVALRSTSYTPAAGDWVHYAIVRSSLTSWSVYINGDNYGNFTNSAIAPAGSLKISQPGEQFAGTIDGLRVWGVARSASEISETRYCSLTPVTTNITNYYSFSDGTAGGNNAGITTVYDQKGLVNGSLINFALSGTVSNFVKGLMQYRFTGTLYVKANATGTNTGESWDDAFTDLQRALEVTKGSLACGIFEIWVAGGTYYPTRDPSGNANPADPRNKTFYLSTLISMYGGFAGTETSFNQRTKQVITANPSILNGDIGMPGNTNDNAYHVVVSVNDHSSTKMDGFTITNGNASGAGDITVENFSVGKKFGGGMINIASRTQVTNCTFLNNKAFSNGGAMYNDQLGTYITSCAFSGNSSSAGGGAIYNTNLTAFTISNSVFSGNTASSGGGVYNENTSGIIFLNCLLAGNTATGNGGAIYNEGTTTKIGNTIIYGNTGSGGIGIANVYYSIVEGALQGGSFNSNANPQYVNAADPDGPDNTWMTADDGLQLNSCSPAIDHGDNGSISLTTDITGAPRRVDVPFITNGFANVILDMGPYENQSNYTDAQIKGSITGGHIIPYPQELKPDYVQSLVNPANVNGAVISWQKNEENNGWVDATPASNTLQYSIPQLTRTTAFRRVVTICGTAYYSDSVLIKVVNPNGAISGRVLSKNGTPVQGIKIYVQKDGVSLSGSTANHRDSATTGPDGTYSVSPIYYGDPAGLNLAVPFIITPVKFNHQFNFDTLRKDLSQVKPQQVNVDFIDKTVFGITGQTYQECTDCLDDNNNVATIICALDSVEMYRDDSYFTKTGQISPGGEYGMYAASVSDPATYKIEPRFKNHVFNPAFNNVVVTDDVANINFRDISTHTISGYLRAGCDDYIGTAVLEFTDIIPNDANGDPRTSCFRKRVTTNAGSGYYSITLPARKYTVRVVSFTPKNGGNVTSPDLLDFVNNKIPKDSLTADITLADDTLDLIYNRPPVIQLTGIDDVCLALPAATKSFAVMQQGVEKTFAINVYQGPMVNGTGCPVKDTTVSLFTNIQVDDINETLTDTLVNGTVQVKLKGGIPNIVAPYYKTLNIQFTDVYGRMASISKNVVVTGVKTNIGTFTTVSPEVPLMVLHDPPGDNSSSFWSTSKTAETALRFFTAQNNNVNIWGEVKIGAKFSAGLGIATENSVWGSIRGALDVGTRKSTDAETILTTTTTQTFATANNSEVVGAQGDVFIGAALNLLYSIANEVKYTAPCSVQVVQKLIIANDGFATQYIYSEDHIRNTILPTLRNFITIPGVTQNQINSYRNQISVWEQVLANNETNKRNAIFDKNFSFDGSAGAISSTTTTRSTKSNTIAFNLELGIDVATELGLEVAGSGASGGVTVGFKMETGISTANTVINETTTGYTLDDDDNGDYFSVNIKKDPVYNTPVFELVAATASCPPEQGAQPRDEMQLIVPVPSQSGVAADGEAEFILKLSNTSQSQETRTYKLQFIQASNPNGAVVTIGGSPAIIPITYSIGYLGEVLVVVKVKRGSANVFSYEGLQFMLSDNCDGSISKTTSISAFFVSACSNISLFNPGDNWVVSNYDNNLLPILFKNYNLATLDNVTLEYMKAGSGNWLTGFTRTAAQVNNSVNGTQVNWNVAGLDDGVYSLRLKLTCPQGTVYSERVSGIIDRQAPILFGRPQPTDNDYVAGDIISVSYNEKIDVFNLSSNKVVIKRLSNNQVIDATISGYDNQLVIVPSQPLTNFPGDSIRIIVKNINDQYGNVKSTPDSFRFTIGSPVTPTAPLQLNINIVNPVMQENANGTIDVHFNLPVNAPNDVRVNYSISGTALYPDDYTVGYDGPQPLVTSFNGAQGTIVIPKNTSTAILKIDPKGNSQLEPDKIILISLNDGGDYYTGLISTLTATIVNDDTATVYRFTGDGNFDAPGNWEDGKVPPSVLLEGDEIIIDPAGTGTCILNVPLTVKPGAKLTVMANKILVVAGYLKQKSDVQ